MKNLLIVGCYISNPNMEQIIYDGLVQLNPHFDIALVSHSPISERIQRLVKYCIYDVDNDIIYSRGTVYWGNYDICEYEIHPNEGRGYHSYAIYKSLTNAVKLLSYDYDSFTYIEGDSFYSKDGIETLKSFKQKADVHNKQATFVQYGNFLSTMSFYCKFDFLIETFKFFKSPDEFIKRADQVSSEGDLENYFFAAALYENKLDQIYIIDGNSQTSLFPDSKINLNVYNGTESTGIAPYVIFVARVENSNDIGIVYHIFNKNSSSESYPFYCDGDFICHLPVTATVWTSVLYPKNERFTLTIGTSSLTYNKSHILSPDNKSFIRFK